MSLLAPVSVGEFLDKLTILEIKSEHITEPEKLGNIQQELAAIRAAWQASPYAKIGLEPELSRLKAVNRQLWDIEDNIRNKERNNHFDAEFIELARSVYVINDRRAALKKALNLKSGSSLVEEKSYAEY